jgi:cytochrome oxidase Cu insertion factor (SCO1/SenC/PrrC family)
MSSSGIGKFHRGYSHNLRTIIFLFALGVLFIGITLYSPSSPAAAPTNRSTGDFRTIPLADVDNNNVYVKDYEGKVLVLEFMATWCLVCAQQEPILKELQSKYQSENVVSLAVSIDPAYDTPDVLRNHIAKKGLTWMITRDTTLMMTNYFQVTEISTILIITPDGEVTNVFKGLTDLDALSRAVDELL